MLKLRKTRAGRQASVQASGYRYGMSTCRDHYEGGTVGADPENSISLLRALRPHLVDETVDTSPLVLPSSSTRATVSGGARAFSPETIEAFGLGYCVKGAMAGRIAIPLADETDTLVAYAGRWRGDDGWPEGQDKYKFPEGFPKSRMLFNLHRILDTDHLVVVEGYFSVLRLHELGIAAVVLMGRSLLPEQEELLAKHGPDRLTLMLAMCPAKDGHDRDFLPCLAGWDFVSTPLLPDGSSPNSIDEALLTSLFLHVHS